MRKVAALILMVLLVGVPVASAASEWNYRIGEEAPAFRLKSLEGKPMALTDLRGHFVVVSFMTSWCPFCNAAAPNFEQLNKNYRDKGVKVLIVDIQEVTGPIGKFVHKHRLTCPVLMDPDGKVAVSYAPPPTIAPDLKREEVMIASFMIIDPEGKIRFLSLNEDMAKFDAKLTTLRARLDQLLAGN